MLHGQKIAVILPAYRAEKTLRRTYAEIPMDVVDYVLLVDDASDDKTVLWRLNWYRSRIFDFSPSLRMTEEYCSSSAVEARLKDCG